MANLILLEEGFQDCDVGWGQAGIANDIFSSLQLVAVAQEVIDDISSIAKRIHDVLKVPGVRKADGMTKLVNAGQVNDRIAQELVA